MITYFDILNPIARPQPQTRRRPPNQPRRPTSRRNKKNGAVDMRRLDGVLQDLGFAPKPHPTIFLENEPDTLFDGLEKFQKSNGLTVDGAVKNKDSETGRALNNAMEEFYNPSARRKAGGGTQDGPNLKIGMEPKRGKRKGANQSNAERSIPERIAELEWNLTQLEITAADLFEELRTETDPKNRADIREELEGIKQQIEDIEEEIRILRQRMA